MDTSWYFEDTSVDFDALYDAKHEEKLERVNNYE